MMYNIGILKLIIKTKYDTLKYLTFCGQNMIYWYEGKEYIEEF